MHGAILPPKGVQHDGEVLDAMLDALSHNLPVMSIVK